MGMPDKALFVTDKWVMEYCFEVIELTSGLAYRCRSCNLCQGHKTPPKLCCEDRPITAYWLERQSCRGKCFAGITAKQVADTVRNEIEMEADLPADERDAIQVTAYETTALAILTLPDFEGW